MRGWFWFCRVLASFSAAACVPGALACDRAVPNKVSDHAASANPTSERRPAAAPPAKYVGVAACQACHQSQAKLWTGSHHDLAIQVANDASVLGDFDDAKFRYFGTVSRFKTDGARYLVETEGKTYEVKYTFGVDPLQQYLVDVGRGHLQTLPMAYDTRPKADGGQRWYHLYPDEHITEGDPLHWLGLAQNWNGGCADCHSTDLQKNYNREAGAYETTFSELNVACESCHGPGSTHQQEALAVLGKQGTWTQGKGLKRSFTKHVDRRWQFFDGRPIAQLVAGPQRPDPNAELAQAGQVQIEACAKCHSRRGDLGGASQLFHDRYRLELLGDATYFADGQIKSEVYDVGSFIQSKMHAAGVVCSDCHDPHTANVRAPGNQLCAGCHSAVVFDTPKHHFHVAGSPGSQCPECHMPTRIYMGVDERHEHQFSVPRPDLSVALGVPNACTSKCHTKAEPKAAAEWASAELAKRFGPQQRPTFAPALDAAWKQKAGGDALLVAVISDPKYSAMARASALLELRNYPHFDSPILARQAKDPSPLLRRALAELAGAWPPERRVPVAKVLLADAVRTVRLEALRALLDADRRTWSKSEEQLFERVREEFSASLSLNADHPGAVLDLARLELLRSPSPVGLQQNPRAEELFRNALALDASFSPAYVNFADYYRAIGRDDEAEVVLTSGLKRAGDPAQLEHALGLTLVRLKKPTQALPHLARAYELRPDLPRLGFVYAVGLNEVGKTRQAIEVLETLHERFSAEQDVLHALIQYHEASGNMARATELRAATLRRE